MQNVKHSNEENARNLANFLVQEDDKNIRNATTKEEFGNVCKRL